MAKQALCVNAYSDLEQLTGGKVDNIRTRFYDRDFCEDPVNGLLQIIPYAVFYAVDEDAGRIHFIQYKRPDQGGDERLTGKTSVGFGGHIDSEDDLVYTDVVKENGVDFYTMNISDLVSTCVKTAKREITEEMGCDVLGEYNIDIQGDKCFFFTGGDNEEVNKVHVALSVPICVDMDTYNKILTECKETINKDEIEIIDDLSVCMDMIVEDMNLNRSIDLLLNELVQNSGLESWSAICIAYIIPRVLNSIFGEITYQDMIALAKQKKSQQEVQ